ncbi:glucose-6-phosphate dehydrogenase [Sphingomicrobium lutaoense]|uniref:Glucose-6-phosphate 1-dehydrogenase n=1 Tax=Sphingomicrobium lutaoense TaxID=515949 RepID=A0A839Z0E4_9SPHN|nr:glucose-6-phosphate dehydrogenase [Sphingomicrobium lutaoense]MBB3763152.1 glucose-6-phosphate 1-dehydrogenase [Sphingomicrobium lutaoense]
MAQRSSTLLLFGATGDLSRRMLLPSLYGLAADGLLPDDIQVIATARTEMDDAEFRELAISNLREHLPADFFSEVTARRFAKRVRYIPVDVTTPEGYDQLADAIDLDKGVSIFLSTAPSLFKTTIENLKRVGLAGPKVHLALEKPLGDDLASSREINDAVAEAFTEDRIFRIDHYLGKETVQNLLALRFANSLLEPVWNAAHIDHVQITVAETVGLEGRAAYYDGAGAVRDMLQNHMLQLLALVAMEPPADYDPVAVREEKVKVLRSLRPMTKVGVRDELVLGQYDAYAGELGEPSDTETFVALKAHVDNWRWAGVPFYLRHGKRMARRKTEVLIQFKCVPHSIFGTMGARTEPNELIISIQPEENIRLKLMAKTPGLDRGGMSLREVPLDVTMEGAFADYRRRIAYERLLLDLIEGDPTLFVRRDEVEAQWQWIDALRQAWQDAGMTPDPYESGSWGPERSSEFAKRDGREWND